MAMDPLAMDPLAMDPLAMGRSRQKIEKAEGKKRA